MFRFACTLAAIAMTVAGSRNAVAQRQSYDIVVYGGTAGGVAAAVQGARMGKSVVLIEPSRHVGGLTSGGLGATDIGDKGAIGGISREFYRRLGEHYADEKSWTFQTRAAYQIARQQPNEREMWTFEPHVAENTLRAMLAEAKVAVVLQKRLKLDAGVRKS